MENYIKYNFNVYNFIRNKSQRISNFVMSIRKAYSYYNAKTSEIDNFQISKITSINFFIFKYLSLMLYPLIIIKPHLLFQYKPNINLLINILCQLNSFLKIWIFMFIVFVFIRNSKIFLLPKRLFILALDFWFPFS